MKKQAKRRPGVGFYIVLTLIAILFFALLELNKNAVWGWIVALVILAGFVFLHVTVLKNAKGILKALTFLPLIALLIAVLALTVGPVKRHPAVAGKNGGVTGIVTIKTGQLTGVYTEDGQVEVYAGIPYAAPPVGDLRWKEPQDPAPWEGVYAADTFAAMSM